MRTDCIRILIVSALNGATEALREQAAQNRQRSALVSCACSARDARRVLKQHSVDIAAICAPLPDDDGLTLAGELIRGSAAGVLLLAAPARCETLRAPAAQQGILTLPMTANADALSQCFQVLTVVSVRSRMLEERVRALENRMDELQLVGRAKLVLVERCRMSEPEAHKFIEKTAMDTCSCRGAVAQRILRAYGN